MIDPPSANNISPDVVIILNLDLASSISSTLKLQDKKHVNQLYYVNHIAIGMHKV